MTLSRAIVRAWMAQSGAPVPERAEMSARLHLLDAVGVGLVAAALDQGLPYRRFNSGTTGAVTALTGACMDDAAEAALINGGLIHSLEFDDTHTASIVHGSAVLAATVLAVAEATHASLAAAICAYLFAYEVMIRMGLAAPGAFQRQGFQITSVAGTLAAALIATDLMGADEEARIHAVGIALSQSSGVFEFLTNGSTVKSMHPGWAAHSGILAARLALASLTGPETAVEGTRGLYAIFAADRDAPARLALLMQDFGTRWHMPDVAFKFVPCCHYLHPFVEAAGDLAAQGVTAAAVDRLTLRIAAGAAGIVCEPWATKIAPADGHSARWSLPVVVAARLVQGRVDHATFARRAPFDVLALAARCRWEPLANDRFPDAFEAEIICDLADGSRHTARVDDVYGNAARPATRDDILAKFRANAGHVLAPADIAALEALFLSSTGDVSTYAGILRRSFRKV